MLELTKGFPSLSPPRIGKPVFETELTKLFAFRSLYKSKSILLTLILIFSTITSIFSQEVKPKKWTDAIEVGGYIKFIPSAVIGGADNILTDNLIHNRINLSFDLTSKWTGELDFRNRLTYGESIKNNPNFATSIDTDNGLIDLSGNWIEGYAAVGNTTIDRAYIDYASDKYEVRIGRQRINWGVNLAWNANDIFNAYSLVDFDYQERPGTDAVRLQYYFSDFTNIDIAYRPGKNLNESVIGGLLKFNNWDYDFQILMGNVNEDLAAGAGWAGNLKNAGFKGEATYFHPKKGTDKGVLSSSFSIDYSFKNSLYLNGSFLLNSGGQNKFDEESLALFGGGTLTAKNLMPTKYSYFLQGSIPINPIVNGSVAVIYGAGMDLFFIMPAVGYSIADNWDIDLTGQIFFADFENDFQNLGNALFLRMRYSY